MPGFETEILRPQTGVLQMSYTRGSSNLPWVLLGMRAAPREETGVSVAEPALQQQLVVAGQLPPPSECGGALCTTGGIPHLGP